MKGESQRQAIRQRLKTETFDVAIIGGGINGAVAVAALSAAGYKVALIEKKDFASSTSQESSNLVWGGIKYLEGYEFSLVWDLCRSRNELMRRYPHEVQELRFFTNLERGFRKPRILVFLGSLLYWFMGRFKTRPPRLLSRATIERDEPLVSTEKSQGGLEYSDCFLKDNDARFVFHFIRRGLRAGAAVLNYIEAKAGRREADGLWSIECMDAGTSEIFPVRARVLINAGGPFADRFNQACGIGTVHQHIFSKGVHLIVPRLNKSERVLTFFADDGRLFFVIPMGSCSCIGTTDTRVTELPAQVTDADRQFILENINKRLKLPKPLTMADVIAERCGVRPLVIRGNAGDFDQEEWINLSRKHILECSRQDAHISIFGGKLTDCLNIGRELVDEVRGLGLPEAQRTIWYGEGDPAIEQQYRQLLSTLHWTDREWMGEGRSSDRLWRLYGDDALGIAERIKADPSLAEPVVADAPVLMAEVAHMADHELIVDLEDFLRRRTRLSLVVRYEVLEQSAGLKKAARILFGPDMETRWKAYFSKEQAKLQQSRA
ncbi:MAG TPA: glycerol-3-phosphate dehydrogenase/oxidase [Oligoflexus sp.]|uniref:glycerol-3-phosphate dehydrogenase/oxidase n=1 Tax=Oligoflexus sp. TaxID=1971216 RepID=UPI002D281352|nr:glycerol-3-phosphate dehydrogenase/oxidase [Oligoflexus sp.]HYX33302.1 glycerol-3-phosphate dehydrogenase/oxidase [Oligoflexus sp.]